MPKLKMLTGLSGPKYSLSPGDQHEFGDAEASRLIRAGFAEATDGFVPVDYQVDTVVENPDSVGETADNVDTEADSEAKADAAAVPAAKKAPVARKAPAAKKAKG